MKKHSVTWPAASALGLVGLLASPVAWAQELPRAWVEYVPMGGGGGGSVAGVTAVPTLSEWSLILLGFLLLAVAYRGLRKRGVNGRLLSQLLLVGVLAAGSWAGGGGSKLMMGVAEAEVMANKALVLPLGYQLIEIDLQENAGRDDLQLSDFTRYLHKINNPTGLKQKLIFKKEDSTPQFPVRFNLDEEVTDLPYCGASGDVNSQGHEWVLPPGESCYIMTNWGGSMG